MASTDHTLIRRLDALVGVGEVASVQCTEQELWRRAMRHLARGFDQDTIAVGLLVDGRLVFSPELSTGVLAGAATGSEPPPRIVKAAHEAMADQQPAGAGDGSLVLPLAVKGRPAGVLVVERRPAGEGALAERDRSLLRSLASQLSIALENARLYGQLGDLFRLYLSPDVAATLLADPSQAMLGGAVVEVTALFADLRGFTSYSEKSSPQQIVAMLNRYFEAATDCVLAEGGTVVQFVGDALMAVFNAPCRQRDHPVRAARAALALQTATAAIAAENRGWPRFRIGVNTGPALVGNIGGERLRNFNAMGDAVNVAARLESIATPGQVVIGPATYAAIRDQATASLLGPLALKGRQAPVEAYVLRALRDPGQGDGR